MNPLAQVKKVTPLFVLSFALACFAFLPGAQGQCVDGCGSGFGTFQGDGALISNTTGVGNTAFGWRSLFSDSTGNFNTSVGGGALALNNADNNTAVGAAALLLNTTGTGNTAVGTAALALSNADGNTAVGATALSSNTDGAGDTALGAAALANNTNGNLNTALGVSALALNTEGGTNTAVGGGDNQKVFAALGHNTAGSGNTAIGTSALGGNTTGSFNIALGIDAGINLTTGGNNIDIGDPGVANEANTIRIGTQGTQMNTYVAGIFGTTSTGSPVGVDSSGHLGVLNTSSARFKDDIKPMENASEAILALKPVTFRYKKEIDPNSIPEFGLVAEEVEKVNPALITRDSTGKPYTVRYDAVNAMLLNEFLKEHRAFVEEQREVRDLEKQVEKLTAGLQKVSAQLELSKRAPQTVKNND